MTISKFDPRRYWIPAALLPALIGATVWLVNDRSVLYSADEAARERIEQVDKQHQAQMAQMRTEMEQIRAEMRRQADISKSLEMAVVKLTTTAENLDRTVRDLSRTRQPQ